MTAGEHSHEEFTQQLAGLQAELAALRAEKEAREMADQATAAAVSAEGSAAAAAGEAYDAQTAITRLEGQIAELAAKLETPPEPEPVPVVIPDPGPIVEELPVEPPPEVENKPTKKDKKPKFSWF